MYEKNYVRLLGAVVQRAIMDVLEDGPHKREAEEWLAVVCPDWDVSDIPRSLLRRTRSPRREETLGNNTV